MTIMKRDLTLAETLDACGWKHALVEPRFRDGRAITDAQGRDRGVLTCTATWVLLREEGLIPMWGCDVCGGLHYTAPPDAVWIGASGKSPRACSKECANVLWKNPPTRPYGGNGEAP